MILRLLLHHRGRIRGGRLDDRDVGTVGPHLRRLLRVVAEGEHVLARGERGRHVDLVDDVEVEEGAERLGLLRRAVAAERLEALGVAVAVEPG